MLTSRTAWGLDIGESTVKAVKMRRTRVGAEILAFDVIERGQASEETGDKDYQLREAVSTLAARNNFGKTPLVVSIPEPAFSRFIPLPPVDEKRIPEVVRYEARQQIPFPIEEVVWDYQRIREEVQPGEETEVAIFSLRSQFVYALLANLRLCKLQPAAVIPVPLALYNYLTFDRDIAKGTIVIDIGAGSTDILICDPENFRVRNITVSGNGLTRALAERLKISPGEAEQLKRECGDKTQAARLFKLIQPTLNDLVGQVQRTIGFFKSQIHNVRIEQALLLGNTFRLPGVREYFIQQLGCDQMPAGALERITLASRVDGSALKQMLPTLSVAIGLALDGVGRGGVGVNLMPHELIRRRAINSKKPFAAASVGCLAIMLLANLYSLNARKRHLQERIEKQETVTQVDKQFDDISKKYDSAARQAGQARDQLNGPLTLSEGFRAIPRAQNMLNRVITELDRKGPWGRKVVVSGIEARPVEEEGKVKILFSVAGYAPGTTRGDSVKVRDNILRKFESSFDEVQYRSPDSRDEVDFVVTCRYTVKGESTGGRP
ncbi:MAG: pilus assembly protein PilM [Planctomycetota bacterium]